MLSSTLGVYWRVSEICSVVMLWLIIMKVSLEKTDGAIRQEDYQLMVSLIQNNKDKLAKFIPLMQN